MAVVELVKRPAIKLAQAITMKSTGLHRRRGRETEGRKKKETKTSAV